MCDPILETLLKIRPHYSQPNRENVTPKEGAVFPPSPPPERMDGSSDRKL